MPATVVTEERTQESPEGGGVDSSWSSDGDILDPRFWSSKAGDA